MVSAAVRKVDTLSAITPVTVSATNIIVSQLSPFVSWQRVLDAFLDAACDSVETRRSYRRSIVTCMEALGVVTLSEVTGAALAAYRAALIGGVNCASTHALALAGIRSFLRWSSRFGACTLTADVIGAALRSPRSHVERPYAIVTDAELAAMLTVAKTARDRALIGVLAGCGTRVSECVGLDVADVHEDQHGAGLLYVRHGKGGRDRIVPAPSSVIALLKCYLSATGRALTDVGPLFRAHDRGASKRDRKRLTSHGAGVVVTDAARRAGVVGKKISAHSLRHTAATRHYAANHDILALSKVLGHASVTTSQRYADHANLENMKAAMPQLPVAA